MKKIKAFFVLIRFWYSDILYQLYRQKQKDKFAPYAIPFSNALFGKPIAQQPIICEYPCTHDIDYVAYCMKSQQVCRTLFRLGLWKHRADILFVCSDPTRTERGYVVEIQGYYKV